MVGGRGSRSMFAVDRGVCYKVVEVGRGEDVVGMCAMDVGRRKWLHGGDTLELDKACERVGRCC